MVFGRVYAHMCRYAAPSHFPRCIVRTSHCVPQDSVHDSHHRRSQRLARWSHTVSLNMSEVWGPERGPAARRSTSTAIECRHPLPPHRGGAFARGADLDPSRDAACLPRPAYGRMARSPVTPHAQHVTPLRAPPLCRAPRRLVSLVWLTVARGARSCRPSSRA